MIIDNYTWDLDNIFNSFDALKTEVDLTKDAIESLKKYKNNLFLNADNLFSYFLLREKIERKIKKLYYFCLLYCDINFDNNKYTQIKSKINQLYAVFKDIDIDNRKELLEIEQLKLDDLIFKNKKLLRYGTEIKKNFDNNHNGDNKNKEHDLIKGIKDTKYRFEKVIQHMKFEPLIIKNKKYVLTENNYSMYMDSSDRNIRKKAFFNYFNAFKKNKDDYYIMYKEHITLYSKLSKKRGYNSSLQSYCNNSVISEKLYERFMNIINNNLDIFNAFFQLKKQILKINKFHFFDVYAPISDNPCYSYDEARLLIINALQPLGDEYSNILEKAFCDNWIDVFPRQNKKYGCYSINSYDLKPYILINFEGKYKDVTILAHELGHSINTYFLNENQFYYFSLTNDELEISSLVNELLLGNYLINSACNNAERITYINNLICIYLTSFYRYGMLAEFEKEVHDYADKNSLISYEQLSECYFNITKKYFGNSVIMDDIIKNEWLKIPHFYNDFYCCKYVVGISCATKIVDNLLKNDENYRQQYIAFLKSGNDIDINKKLQNLNIDIYDDCLYFETINKIKQLIALLKNNLQD